MQGTEPRKSKTRVKLEMIELQKLGVRLAELPDGYLKRSGIPQELLEAIRALRTISSFGARRRQMQHIGAIMREVDAVHARQVLEAFGQPRGCTQARQKDVEELAASLLQGGDSQVEALMQRCPGADRTRVRQFLRKARSESLGENPGVALEALKAYLREILH
ncbi:MAG TPA: ribosome biogenesis factor YjgA [Deltaproteobacteria bacterium]|nr:ribosome biogenesis factor YjgA [Deltaproteobacteria bacterium]